MCFVVTWRNYLLKIYNSSAEKLILVTMYTLFYSLYYKVDISSSSKYFQDIWAATNHLLKAIEPEDGAGNVGRRARYIDRLARRNDQEFGFRTEGVAKLFWTNVVFCSEKRFIYCLLHIEIFIAIFFQPSSR